MIGNIAMQVLESLKLVSTRKTTANIFTCLKYIQKFDGKDDTAIDRCSTKQLLKKNSLLEFFHSSYVVRHRSSAFFKYAKHTVKVEHGKGVFLCISFVK